MSATEVITAAAQEAALPDVHFTKLKLMGRSPAHYAEAMRAEQEATDPMLRGSAVHSMILNGSNVIAYPGAVRRGKEWEAFRAEHADEIILTGTEFAKSEAIAAAVRAHPEAMRVLTGEREKEIAWSVLGRRCAGRLDCLAVDRSFVTDLKTTACSEPGRFTGQAIRMAYHAQLAWYVDGVVACGLGKPEIAYVVAVEASPPFAVTVMRITPRTLDMGRRLCRLWMERLLACEAAGKWPAYCDSVVDLDMPEDLELLFDEVERAGAVPF